MWSRELSGGETRDRTGDTTIFNRMLYQLSYLATRDVRADHSQSAEVVKRKG